MVDFSSMAIEEEEEEEKEEREEFEDVVGVEGEVLVGEFQGVLEWKRRMGKGFVWLYSAEG